MSTKYLLPCECGKNIPVESVQAGQTVRCACGRDMDVPTLLKLRSLETVEDESQGRTTARWGVFHALAIVGATVVLATFVALVYFHWNQPVPPKDLYTEQIIERDINHLTLLRSYDVWEQLRHALRDSRPVDKAYRKKLKTYRISKYATVEEAYHEATKQYHIRLGIALVILALAGAMTITSLVMCRVRARGTSREDPAGSSP
ncbi:MAG: hypothetical protein JW888_14600 [Pirellulales bacterium]|nr:hypothetical protein [Pirellulales bacterium]